MIKILVVDDHSIIRDSLSKMLSAGPFQVIGEASDGLEAIDFLKNNQDVDVVTMDINMPNLDGYEATKRITSEFPNVKVIILSMFANDTAIRKALYAGAMGFVTKDSSLPSLKEGIKKVFEGEKYLSSEASNSLLNKIINQTEKKQDTSLDAGEVYLTDRELEVIKLICKEKSSSEIATELSLNVRTIESHRHNIIKKLQVTSSVGIVIYAIKNGIHKIEDKIHKNPQH